LTGVEQGPRNFDRGCRRAPRAPNSERLIADAPLRKRTRGDGRCPARTGDLLLVRREQVLRSTAPGRSGRSASDPMCCALLRFVASKPLPHERFKGRGDHCRFRAKAAVAPMQTGQVTVSAGRVLRRDTWRAMSQANVDLVERSYAAVNEAHETGGWSRFKRYAEETFAPNLILDPGEAGLFTKGERRGRGELIKFVKGPDRGSSTTFGASGPYALTPSRSRSGR
jgi:hypothetical protein